MNLIYFLLSGYGLTLILVYSSILNKIRPKKESFGGLGKVFHCPMCMGFWVGIFLLLINKYTTLFSFEYSVINALLLGFINSGTSYILSMFINDSGIRIERK